MRAMLFVLLCACGGGGVKDIKDTPPPAPEATCRMAGEKLTELLVAMQKTPPPDEAVNAQIEKTAKVCEDNQWSAAARSCFSKIQNLEQADGCTKELTTQQLEALAGGQRECEASQSAPEGGAPPGGTRGMPSDDNPKGSKGSGNGQGASADPCDGGE